MPETSPPLPSLRGRRVAVTRGPAPGPDALSARLLELGAEVLEVPSIAVVAPRSWDELDGALRAIDTFDWVVFASANAVEHTVARAAALGVPPAALVRPKLAAVGPATAAALRRAVREPDRVPADARGAALAAEIAPLVRGARVLLPRAEEGRPELLDGLVEAGAAVTAATAYRTVAASPEAIRPLRLALEAAALHAVTFASPSAVKSVVGALADAARLLSTVMVAAIGPTTAQAARELGVEVRVVPREHSARALADALADALGPM